jgi:hypothetical protein
MEDGPLEPAIAEIYAARNGAGKVMWVAQCYIHFTPDWVFHGESRTAHRLLRW